MPLGPKNLERKVKATFVMLVRDKELYGAVSTVQQIEDRFNRHYQYPYVFLNDKPFTNSFKDVMKRASKAEMIFSVVPTDHWSYPPWISQERAAEARDTMKNVIYGYQSGLLVQHEAILPYDYYWRIEPNVKYSCDIEFDPFLYMQNNNKKFGMTNVSSRVDAYSRCHFWSNFEIVDARWMRGDAFQQYFKHLDQAGGFFYERWGDAPVHTIAAALLLSISEIHFFREIGYYHPPFHNCPAEPELQAKCHCDPALNVNRERYTCTSKFLEMANEKRMVYPEELDDYF
ncbi:hypothetical protein BGZ65_002423 [Modicella reniformis]|uniref:Uncharacterized protein n=1 Tax=Modicella reniformis TaxID=1440133 RepID=A0A9P6IL49_9FUNG|nr:hypothetical protein BGZ65_002423 [Modicella reniformis]